jgi:S-adenosyl-L-methionine hydrolase (adenosine-forming)
MPPITLLTDFGTSDGYVAQMKGVILGIDPAATIVDVSHEITAGDIWRAGLVLDQVADAFPAGTIHVAVVDPGVGSDRGIIGVEAGGQRFLAPDNGLLTTLLERYPPMRVYRLTEACFWRAQVSATFHGRDVFSPVAARWKQGIDLSAFGHSLDPAALVRLTIPIPRYEDGDWIGEVIAADHFGNLITNLRPSEIGAGNCEAMTISIGAARIAGVNQFYAQREPGSLMALVGSSGRLEIAVNGGSAAGRLGMGVGTEVRMNGPH